MSSNYDEGPYKAWTAIHFPPAYTYQVTTVVNNTLNNIVNIRQFPPEGGSFDAELLQGIITGDTSGASVDLRLLPVVTTVSTSLGAPMGCAITQAGYYTYPGAGSPGSEPWLAAAVFDDTGGFSAAAWAYIRGQPSYTAVLQNPDDDPVDWHYACESDDNAPSTPVFISGESCTITYE